MLRTNHGCWSCRIRRQKCDETRPFCKTCTSRNITCYGYGKKPDWLDGGHQERIVANNLKRQVADNLRRKRQERASLILNNQVVSHESHFVSSNDMDEFVDQTVSGTIRIPTTDAHTSEQLLLSSESPSLGPGHLTSYREAELTMHYMDVVFPLQFRFHVPDARGRGWLLWLLVQSRPLYHAALSLSALHQSIYMPIQFESSYAELAGYHAQTLKDLRRFLQTIQENNMQDEKNRKIEILSCGVSLISFEVESCLSQFRYHLS
jgi:hypothetical protein